MITSWEENNNADACMRMFHDENFDIRVSKVTRTPRVISNFTAHDARELKRRFKEKIYHKRTQYRTIL